MVFDWTLWNAKHNGFGFISTVDINFEQYLCTYNEYQMKKKRKKNCCTRNMKYNMPFWFINIIKVLITLNAQLRGRFFRCVCALACKERQQRRRRRRQGRQQHNHQRTTQYLVKPWLRGSMYRHSLLFISAHKNSKLLNGEKLPEPNKWKRIALDNFH